MARVTEMYRWIKIRVLGRCSKVGCFKKRLWFSNSPICPHCQIDGALRNLDVCIAGERIKKERGKKLLELEPEVWKFKKEFPEMKIFKEITAKIEETKKKESFKKENSEISEDNG